MNDDKIINKQNKIINDNIHPIFIDEDKLFTVVDFIK